MEIATLAGGCFWCLEAVFDELKGIQSVESGYMGGFVDNPTYEAVCSGSTGHAEVVRVTFNPEEITFRELLEVFFAIHDPTTMNRQGNDVGTQYRSAIFFHSPEQEKEAREFIASLNIDHPVVTEIVPASRFYEAEPYHQEYFRNHPNQPYCVFAVRPKLDKFRKYFPEQRKQS